VHRGNLLLQEGNYEAAAAAYTEAISYRADLGGLSAIPVVHFWSRTITTVPSMIPIEPSSSNQIWFTRRESQHGIPWERRLRTRDSRFSASDQPGTKFRLSLQQPWLCIFSDEKT
jgi:hypothetical protein